MKNIHLIILGLFVGANALFGAGKVFCDRAGESQQALIIPERAARVFGEGESAIPTDWEGTYDGGNQEAVIRRTMAYSAKLFPDGDFETLYQRSKEHLLDKYAEGGYLRLWLNSERNVRGLEELRAIIRDEEKLRELAKGD